MRHYDLSPFYKTAIGFDHLASLLNDVNGRSENVPNYPPYNIERVDEQHYRLTMAVAGFSDDDLFMEVNSNVLTVRGEKKAGNDTVEYLHQGIAARNFERQFSLEEYVQVDEAYLENGLLHIDLFRKVPEAKKPRKIEIGKKRPHKTPLINQEAEKDSVSPVAAE